MLIKKYICTFFLFAQTILNNNYSPVYAADNSQKIGSLTSRSDLSLKEKLAKLNKDLMNIDQEIARLTSEKEKHQDSLRQASQQQDNESEEKAAQNLREVFEKIEKLKKVQNSIRIPKLI